MQELKSNKRKGSGVSIRIVGGIVVFVAVLLALYAFSLAERIDRAQATVVEGERRNVECVEAISNLQMASDFLTTQARTFVVTGRRENLDAYVDELEVNNRRGEAVEVLRSTFAENHAAYNALSEALSASDALTQTELAAMRLAANHYGIDNLPDVVENAKASQFGRHESSEDDLDIATRLVLDANYDQAKENISAKVSASTEALLAELDASHAESQQLVQSLLVQLRITVALLLCAIMVLVLALFMYVLKPLSGYVKRISENEPLQLDGAYELHYLANAYNEMYEDNARHIENLRSLAERDTLTGISNRNGYASFLATHTRDIALLLIDIDNFAEYNRVYGHDVGDAALVCLARALTEAFRSTDFPCRIENDEFAVIMTNTSSDLRSVIIAKIDRVIAILSDSSDELPLITLSVGAAFSTEGMSDQDIYHAAGLALESAKRSESGGIVFYGEHTVE